MIHDFHIQGFRRFTDYRLKDLRRVNLLVGDNNCGKTTVLEGLHCLGSKGNPRTLVDAAARRGEILYGSSSLSLHGDDLYPDLSHFFNGHQLSDGVEFRLSASDQNLEVKVVNEPADPIHGKLGQPFQGVVAGFPAEAVYWLQLRYESDYGEKSHRLTRIGDTGALEERWLESRIPGTHTADESSPSVFVALDGFDASSIRALWDKVNRIGRETDVEESLRIIAPGLRDVYIDSATPLVTAGPSNGRFNRVGIHVRLDTNLQRVPLASMGEGMFRALALGLAFTASSGNTLLIDEIDTGLHWSHLSDIWRMVIKTAKAHNSQVFATTHSADCLKGLASVCDIHPELADEVSVHTIDPKLEESVVVPGSRLAMVVGAEIEVR